MSYWFFLLLLFLSDDVFSKHGFSSKIKHHFKMWFQFKNEPYFQNALVQYMKLHFENTHLQYKL